MEIASFWWFSLVGDFWGFGGFGVLVLFLPIRWCLLI